MIIRNTKIKNTLNKALPESIFNLLYNAYKGIRDYSFYRNIRKIRKQQHEIVASLQKKEIINVIFLIMVEAIWKYEELYKLLSKNPRFKITVVPIPLTREGLAQMDGYEQTLNYFNNNGYNTFKSFDQNSGTWLDIKDILRPDLVFFANPYPWMTFDKYAIDHFTNSLTCYVPYCFQVSKLFKMQRDGPFHSKLWKQFYETKIHEEESKNNSRTKGDNVMMSGFPGVDSVFNKNYNPKDPWKKSKHGKTVKIIWAPHHTIAGHGCGLDWSNFMDYHEYFLNLIQTNENIQIAFKPHPMLRENLSKEEVWGKERTDQYYEKWNSLPNGQLEQSYYAELFYFSDALITDSGGFIVEYLYVDKPILFAKSHNNILETFNSFGQEVFNVLYQANNKTEVGNFIAEVVLKNQDSLNKKRNQFLKEAVLPPNGITASENIYNELIKELG
ncbi:CDP-glycerol glycerophosphotransferase family protein [uncultured Eudoraea sp.]|uniref:CDP-glycerol glycerophosphotransferase family protein n=1 Tax=uncultured Eudoraea sp. TaxID=1035614 RepID=UPI002621F1EC|nr:CDP-glycerol glycerophosphotransferase family protein [uncultured Eudoraea sp.]